MPSHSTPLGPGLNDSSNPEALGARLVFRFYAAAAITNGDIVVLDRADTTYGLGNSVKKSTTTADAIDVVGVADATCTAGSWVPVVVWGLKQNANVADAVSAGDGLQSSTTAGRAGARGAGETYFAIALEDGNSDNQADVFVKALGPSAP